MFRTGELLAALMCGFTPDDGSLVYVVYNSKESHAACCRVPPRTPCDTLSSCRVSPWHCNEFMHAVQLLHAPHACRECVRAVDEFASSRNEGRARRGP